MHIATFLFTASLLGLFGMILAKQKSLQTGRPGVLAFLSHFDPPVASFLLRVTARMQAFSVSLRRNAILSLEGSHHFIASLLHFFVQTIERRMRAWREFARTRKLVRRDASGFIKEVGDYKKELKQDGHGQ